MKARVYHGSLDNEPQEISLLDVVVQAGLEIIEKFLFKGLARRIETILDVLSVVPEMTHDSTQKAVLTLEVTLNESDINARFAGDIPGGNGVIPVPGEKLKARLEQFFRSSFPRPFADCFGCFCSFQVLPA
jgi:hypothetical protein